MKVEAALSHIAELGHTSRDRAALRPRLLDLLQATVGFDKASLHSIGPAGQQISARGFEDTAAFAALPDYMSELEPRELAMLSGDRPQVDVDVLPARRRAALSVYREVLQPERIRAFVTVMWSDDEGAAGASLGRTGRGARFTPPEMRMLALLLPSIRLADALVALRQRQHRTFEAWAGEAGLGAHEREVAALAMRGLTNPEIAVVRGVSPNTVRNQLAAVFRKADVSTRAELGFVASSYAGKVVGAGRPPWVAHLR